MNFETANELLEQLLKTKKQEGINILRFANLNSIFSENLTKYALLNSTIHKYLAYIINDAENDYFNEDGQKYVKLYNSTDSVSL
jgi:hypothetical protein